MSGSLVFSLVRKRSADVFGDEAQANTLAEAVCQVTCFLDQEMPFGPI